jgi:hypothetical protein
MVDWSALAKPSAPEPPRPPAGSVKKRPAPKKRRPAKKRPPRAKPGLELDRYDISLLLFAVDTWCRAYAKNARRAPDGESARKMVAMRALQERLQGALKRLQDASK